MTLPQLHLPPCYHPSSPATLLSVQISARVAAAAGSRLHLPLRHHPSSPPLVIACLLRSLGAEQSAPLPLPHTASPSSITLAYHKSLSSSSSKSSSIFPSSPFFYFAYGEALFIKFFMPVENQINACLNTGYLVQRIDQLWFFIDPGRKKQQFIFDSGSVSTSASYKCPC